MRIINSKFERLPPNTNDNPTSEIIYKVIPDRAGAANSNTYTSASLDKETSLILNSDKILKIDYNSIEDGGQLTYGNYVYIFEYMTEDFNATDVVGQSSVCSVFSGTSVNNTKGGFQTDAANKLVKLDLSNVDTDFKYFRVHFKYSSGTRDAEYNAVFEMTTPIPITGESMVFIHSGFEETFEVEESVINLDSSIIDSAATGEAVGGYLMLGDIVEREYDYTDFADVASEVTMDEVITTFEANNGQGFYNDPQHIYESLGNFGGETYPWGMIFILPDGKLTPPFPVVGKDMVTNTTNNKGLFRHSNSNDKPTVESISPGAFILPSINVKTKSVKFDLATVIPAKLTTIQEKSLGYFFVRGDRKADLITQGILIPTLRVPPLSFTSVDGDTGGGEVDFSTFPYYWSNVDDESVYRFVPCLDNLVEGYWKKTYDDTPSDSGPDRREKYVVDDRNQEADGYMPVFVNDLQNQALTGGGGSAAQVAINNYSEKHWVLITGESLLNNPEAISLLNGRSGVNIQQLGKITSRVAGQITPLQDDDGPISNGNIINIGLHYDEYDFESYSSNSNDIESISSVPNKTFASGSNFISKLDFDLFYYRTGDGVGNQNLYHASQEFNEYFGITLTNAQLTHDGDKAIDNPIGGNTRRSHKYEDHHTTSGWKQETAGLAYNNLGTLVPASFLVNLYQGGQRTDIEALYPTLDGVIYRQAGNRFEWSDLPTSKTVEIFGGDCYISKVTRKLNQSGFPNSTTPFDRKNIHAGISISWWQESKYNLHLRIPFRFDESETSDRSFFPFKGGGNYESFRQYRLPETVEGNKGFSVTSLPKSFIPISELAPSIKSSFFSRIHHSARHVPNAFANGYRIFEGLNFRDYDTAMGSIVMVLNHRGNLVILFEHGVGVTSIEQRIQTGEDFAGQIFVKPSDVLPPTLQFYSRDIGCQQPKSVVQTPSAIYFLDADKHKICQIREKLTVITEDGLSSFMNNATFKNPRSGYDFEYSEILFTTDDWTLCFKEGLEKFTSFYTFRPSHYVTRSDEFYSFTSNRFHKHNANTKLIYGNLEESYIEFTVNEGVGASKVYDYLNIISNDVEPLKIEFFTYSDRTYNEDIISTTKIEQYSKVEQDIDFFTEEDTIRYKDKKFVVQIPNTEIYNKKSDKDSWDKEGRMRNKYMIMRLTYKTEDYLHLIAILTSIRNSFS